jgi:hypothetical protein
MKVSLAARGRLEPQGRPLLGGTSRGPAVPHLHLPFLHHILHRPVSMMHQLRFHTANHRASPLEERAYRMANLPEPYPRDENDAPSKRFRFDYSKRFASSASRRPGNLSKRAAAKDYS